MRTPKQAAVTVLGVAAFLGAGAMFVETGSVRAQSVEPAKPPACTTAGTYTVDVDGAPDRGACRAFVDQATPASFNIPPGKLFDALKAYLEQSGARGMIPLDIMMAEICTGPSKCTRGPIPAAGVSGNLPPREALERLLNGTGVTFVQDQAGTFRFPRVKDAAVPGGRCQWDKSPWKGCPPL